MFMSAMVRIFSWVERWNVPLNGKLFYVQQISPRKICFVLSWKKFCLEDRTKQ